MWCFGITSSIQMLRICPLGRLSRYCWLCLRSSIPRGESHVPEKSCTCPLRFLAHFSGHNSLTSPGRSTPTDSENSMRFRRFPRKSQAPKNRGRPSWGCQALKSQCRLRQCQPTCPRFFFPWHAVAWFWAFFVTPEDCFARLDMLSCRQRYRLKWVRKPTYFVHLDSAGRRTISRVNRGRDPCKTLLLLSPSAERGSEKGFTTHEGMSSSELLWKT